MTIEDKKILHINAALADISNGQLAVELVVDPDLAFRMWGGKDHSGDIVRFLCKDKAAQILSLKISNLAGVHGGLVRHSTTGVLSGGLITLAALNALISDADLDDAGTKREPTLHGIDSATHHDGVGAAVEDNFLSFDANALPKDSGVSALVAGRALGPLVAITGNTTLTAADTGKRYIADTGGGDDPIVVDLPVGGVTAELRFFLFNAASKPVQFACGGAEVIFLDTSGSSPSKVQLDENFGWLEVLSTGANSYMVTRGSGRWFNADSPTEFKLFDGAVHDGTDLIYTLNKGAHKFVTEAQYARSTMTLTGLPLVDETFVVNLTTLTAKADGSGNIDHFTIGGTVAATVTNILATLAECTEAADIRAWAGAGTTLIAEWKTAGVIGNSKTFTEAMTNTTVDGAGTFGATHAGVDAATLFKINEDGIVESENAIHIAETTTPTAIADSGALYAKSDNKLYFQDGAGVEHLLALGPFDNAEMGNTASAPEVLHSADEWHGMFHANIDASSPRLIEGFSFVAGKEGAGNITTAGGGARINIADVDHGLVSGDYVTVQSASHVGINLVTYIDADNFTVTISYVQDEVCTWQMGSYLLCATAGRYRGVWNASFTQSLANAQTSTASPVVNTTVVVKATSTHALDNASDVGHFGGNGLMDFVVGDRIWFVTKSTGAQTLTFTMRNISIR